VRPLDRRKLAAARLWGATRLPYLASALFAARILPVQQPGVVAVDEAWRVWIDPDVLGAWSAPQLGSVLVHHVGHLLRDHAARARALGLGHEQAGRWVLAADAEINDDLAGTGLEFPLPPITPQALGFPPHRFAEEYFRGLPAAERDRDRGSGCGGLPAGPPRRRPPAPDHRDCGSGCDGLPRAWDQPGGLPRHQRQLLRYQVASDIVKSCRGPFAGTVPAGLRRWAEDVLGARGDWRKVLAAEIRRGVSVVAGMVDYSYRKPSRRSTVVDAVVLPGFVRPVPELAVVIDTSGSMSETLLGQALAEVEGLIRAAGTGARRLRVIPCDAAAHRVQRVTAARQIDLLGGGGTNMGEGIAAARALRPRPSLVVILTDGYTAWPAEPPGGMHVVVGLLHAGGPPPPHWARVVQIEAA
jgi:predicted metal-dependent peptidase